MPIMLADKPNPPLNARERSRKEIDLNLNVSPRTLPSHSRGRHSDHLTGQCNEIRRKARILKESKESCSLKSAVRMWWGEVGGRE